MYVCSLVFIGATALTYVYVDLGRNMEVNRNTSHQEEGCPICPANCFRLSVSDVLKNEFDALQDGDAEAARRLADYYGIFLNKPSVGEVWRFRAAQLGDINAARSLCERRLLERGERSYFKEVIDSPFFTGLSDVTRRYVLFHANGHGQKDSTPSESSRSLPVQDWDEEPAILRTGNVNAAFSRGASVLSWPMGYVAYKARCDKSSCQEKDVTEVLVFPSFDGFCQKAVDFAEGNCLNWIVVAVDFADSFKCRPKEVSLKECCRCVCKVLKEVFADFSLPNTTAVRFAESAAFAEQMKAEVTGVVVMPAPSHLMEPVAKPLPLP